MSGKCIHDWSVKEFYATQGLVCALYHCVICGKEVEQYIGETWKPDQKGEFD